MFKYLLWVYCAAHISYGCDSSISYIKASFNVDTDQIQFDLSGKPTIALDRITLRMVAPDLMQQIWLAESAENIPTWCLLESLDVKFGNHNAVSCPEDVQKKKKLIDSPSVLMKALKKANSMGIDAVENDLIARLAAALVSSRSKRQFLHEPAQFKQKYEPRLSLLSSYQQRRLKEELIAPQVDFVVPIERACLESPQRTVNRCMFSPLNSLLLSMSEDLHSFCLWDLRKRSLRYELKDRLSIGTCIVFGTDDSRVALSRGSDVLILDPSDTSNKYAKVHIDDLEEPLIFTLDLDPKSNALVCNKQWYADDITDVLSKHQEPSAHQKTIQSLSRVFPEIYSSPPVFHANGVDYAIGLRSGYVEVIAQDIKEQVFIDDSPITAVGLSDTNNYVVGASQNGIIRVYQYGLLALISVYRALMVRYIPAYVHDMKQPFPLRVRGKDISHYQWVSALPDGLKARLMPLLEIVQ